VMFDLISSICAALVILCAANIYLSGKVIFDYEYDENDQWQKEKHRFAIGVFLLNIYMFFGAIGWLLWDADIISKTTQYKIGLISRPFAIVGNFLFFLTLSLGIRHKHKLTVVCSAVAIAISVYAWKVFT